VPPLLNSSGATVGSRDDLGDDHTDNDYNDDDDDNCANARRLRLVRTGR